MAPNQSLWPFMVVAGLGAILFFYILRLRNPKLTTVTVGPLFLYLVAASIGVTHLYIMGTMVLSVCVVCWAFSLVSLRHLEVTRWAGSRVSRGDAVEIRVEVANRHWLPKLFLRVCCPLPAGLHSEEKSFAITGLWPGQSSVHVMRAVAGRRGCHALPPVEVVGSDPLDIFPRTGRWPLPAEVIVYPAVEASPGEELWGDDLSGVLPAHHIWRPSRGLEFHSVRDYQSGDDLRTVDWKATARLSRLVVVEFEPTQVGDVVILVDNRPEVQEGPGEDSTLERAVSLAAGVAVSTLAARGTVRLRFLQPEATGDVLVRGGDPADRFLEALARLEPCRGSLESLLPEDVRGRVVLLITSGTGPEVLDVTRRAVAHGGQPAVILLDADSFARGTHQGWTGSTAEATAVLLRGGGARVRLVAHAWAARQPDAPRLEVA